jgi:hypothetical protein
VAGIVVKDDGVVEVVSKKKQQTLRKRSLLIRVDSSRKIELTLWGEEADKVPLDLGTNPVIVIKNGRINEFSGKSILIRLSVSDHRSLETVIRCRKKFVKQF